MTEEYSYFPEPCTNPTHIHGCAGRAGGEHELRAFDQQMADEVRLEVGRLVFDRFLDDVRGNRIVEATAWLEALGFGRVEWVQGSQDDILLLLLWRFRSHEDIAGPDRVLDEFILEFSGYDAANISLFNLVKEVSM